MKSLISAVITVLGALLMTVLVTLLSSEICEFGLEVFSLDTTFQIECQSWFEKGSDTLGCRACSNLHRKVTWSAILKGGNYQTQIK